MSETPNLQPVVVSRTQGVHETRDAGQGRLVLSRLPSGVGALGHPSHYGSLGLRPASQCSQVAEEIAERHRAPIRAPNIRRSNSRRKGADEKSVSQGNGMTLREQLRAARSAAGLTQEQVAAKLGFKQSIISRWETGKEPMPDLDTIERWAAAIGARLTMRIETGTDPIDDLRGRLTPAQVAAVAALLGEDVKKVS